MGVGDMTFNWLTKEVAIWRLNWAESLSSSSASFKLVICSIFTADTLAPSSDDSETGEISTKLISVMSLPTGCKHQHCQHAERHYSRDRQRRYKDGTVLPDLTLNQCHLMLDHARAPLTFATKISATDGVRISPSPSRCSRLTPSNSMTDLPNIWPSAMGPSPLALSASAPDAATST